MMHHKTLSAWPGVLEHYRGYMGWLPEGAKIVTLLEGNTPLIPAPNLAREAGGGFDLFLKFEGLNPTSSFKDRGMTAAMTQALARGSKLVICASTGNTSASAAAYAGRAGLRCAVILPHGKIALGKLAQARMYGAEIVAIRGNFDEALRLVRELGARPGVEVVNSINPVRIEGQKTAAFEICDILGRAPDFHFLPVGNAGNITAYWKGYKEYHQGGRISSLPRMCGFQAAGAAPIVEGKPVTDPQTVATAIRIGNPASWTGATAAVNESQGLIESVTDAEILAAYALAARLEGVFAEPASAAPLAGLLRMGRRGLIPKASVITVTLTGHGLKDPDTAMSQQQGEARVVEPRLEAVLQCLAIS
ncbi:MAG: threonine synthase [Methylacidiphilales bacterium]|nr:threonine synthase [Candidatus Methylacidiphilales bacterium]